MADQPTEAPGAPSVSSAPPAADDTPPYVSLGTIFWIFFQIGSLSIGGGLTAWLYREVVEKRGLLKDADFMSAMTLAQVLPGINMTNLSVYVGQRLRGLKGALTAIAGLLLVPFFAIITIGTIYAQLRAYPWLSHVLDGMAAVAVGLLMSMCVKAIKVTRMDRVQILLAAIVVVTVGLFRWPMIPVILVMVPVSVALAWPKEENSDDNADKGAADA